MLSVRIIVLNYERKDLLERFMPSVIAAAAASRYGCRVSLLDNKSTDGSAELVRSRFPSVDVFEASDNKVLCSFNEIARHLSEDILIFLNNDIEPDAGFVDPLVRCFERHTDAFFAATYGDRARPIFHWGVPAADIYYKGFEHAIIRPGPSLSAGIGAFDRKKFLQLGGYDEIYLPGYYEDVDLCFRAWKRGYRGYYVPESKQFHMGGETFNKKYNAYARQRLVYRNSLIFCMKNLSDPYLVIRFWTLLWLRQLTAMVLGRGFVRDGFADAMRLRAAVRLRRLALQGHSVRSDTSIFKECSR